MSHTLSETASFDANIVVPDNGDALDATTADAPLLKLANRTKHLRFDGRLDWNGEISNTPSSADVVVGPIPYLSLGGVLLSTSSSTNVTTSGLAADTWYYLYAYNDAGSLLIEYSTTGPDASRVFKSGDTTRRYLGLFRSNGSSVILPFRAHRGEYLYHVSALAGSNWVVFNDGAPGAGITLDCGSLKPAWAKHVMLDVAVRNSSSGLILASLYSVTSETGLPKTVESVSGDQVYERFWMMTPDHQVWITSTVVGGTAHVSVWVAGFKE